MHATQFPSNPSNKHAKSQAIFILTALPTSEICWSLQVWRPNQNNKHVISWGIFSPKVIRAEANQNSPYLASPVNTKTLPLRLKLMSQQTRLVLSSDAWSTRLHGALSKHTGGHTQERLGVFIGPLSCYRVISEYRLFGHLSSPTVKHTCVHPKSKCWRLRKTGLLKTERPSVWLIELIWV